ncbi:50S ribosomal protein L18 [Patescibacteria group bacterium]|nr:50S ribosomal protein L18 [Patescibacteria group bacterium]
MITQNSKERRALKVRRKLASNMGIPRLTVFRSNRHLWVQIIDDKRGLTLVSANSKKLSSKLSKIKQAEAVGLAIAATAKKAKITKVRFDRGPYLYHGRIKALADAARQGGLLF